MPARNQGVEWTVVLSVKVAEKRFNALLSIITPLILYKSLPGINQSIYRSVNLYIYLTYHSIYLLFN
jgi:hypothetical protein